MSIIRCKSWVIDGYIGVGKSSAIRNTGTLLKKHSPNINFRSYQENVEEWQNYNGVNLLKRMYEDPESIWKVRFQQKAILDIQEQDYEIRMSPPATLSIQERDLMSIQLVFLPKLENEISSIDYHLLQDQVTLGLRENAFKKRIFLHADVDVCFERMKKRGREAEMALSREQFIELCSQMWQMKIACHHSIDCTTLTEDEVARKILEIVLLVSI